MKSPTPGVTRSPPGHGKMGKMGKMGGNGGKWGEMGKNGGKWRKMEENGEKWRKMGQNEGLYDAGACPSATATSLTTDMIATQAFGRRCIQSKDSY